MKKLTTREMFPGEGPDTRFSRKCFHVSLGTLLLAGLLSAGCNCMDTVEMPNVFHPGHIDVQRARMERSNPYAEKGFAPGIDGQYSAGAGVPREAVTEFHGRSKVTTGFP